MPFRSKTYYVTFRKGIPKFFCIKLCRIAQNRLNGITARFQVNQSEDDPFTCVASLIEGDTGMLKHHIEEVISEHMFEIFKHLPKWGLEFLVNEIMKEKDFDVEFICSQWEEKYTSRIDFLGEDSEAFIDTLKHHYDQYLYDIPQIFSLMIMDRMECKLSRDEIDVKSCGSYSIIYPRGENAEDFIEEFRSNLLKTVERTFAISGFSDDKIIEFCKSIEPKNTYFHIKNGICTLRGFEDTIGEFSDKVKKIIESEKEKDKNKSPKFNCKILDLSEEQIEELSSDVIFGMTEEEF